MPSFQDRMTQLRSEELPEFPMTGPFGGVQSELPESLISQFGFIDVQNFLFLRGAAVVRPGIIDIVTSNLPMANPVNFADYFDSNATIQQVMFYNTDTNPVTLHVALYSPTTQLYNDLTGPALIGNGFPQAWAIINNLLCFSQNPINGIANTPIQTVFASGNNYSAASVNAPTALNMMELDTHLLVSNVVEASTTLLLPKTYMWSGAGDPTDWTSFSAGQNNVLYDFGPAVGLLKLGQYGYGWHIKGIVQIVPTGIGTAPFAFSPILSSRNGLYARYSLSKVAIQGTDCAVYVGFDNIYLWNGSSIIPIGDNPIDNRRRLGARKRIFADILLALNIGGQAAVQGVVSRALSGLPYNAYWLFCNAGSGTIAWVYNFDEGNWTRLFFNFPFSCVGIFYAGLSANTQSVSETINIGQFGTQSSDVAYFDFGAPCETSLYIASGDYIFDDRRHKHSVKKWRLVATDNGPVTYVITYTNESGVTDTEEVVTAGLNDGKDKSYVVPFDITGIRTSWQIACLPGSPAAIVEFAPIYDVGGEQRTGTVDGQ